MGRKDDLPFSRGQTWFNGENIPSTAPSVGDREGGWNLEGKEYQHEDETYGTGFLVTVRAVRNTSTKNILPGQLVDVSGVLGYYGEAVLPGTNAKAPVTVADTYSFPADEFLPPAGVVPGDLFWIVTGGPALLKSTATGTPTVSVLQKVAACTANGSTSADAGGVAGVPSTDSALNFSLAVGRAMSALTSGQTDTPVLIGIGW